MNKIIGLIVITGPSGVGKGTLVSQLLKRNNDLWLSISATTRAPREGEKEGVNYFFLKKDEFQNLVEEKGLLEWAEFAGNFYGTPEKEVNAKLNEGKKVLLEIELEGARQVRKNFPNSFQIFIAPPSIQELEKRIRGRGTESEDSIKKRLLIALNEINAKEEFDAVVVNDEIEASLTQLERLIGLS